MSVRSPRRSGVTIPTIVAPYGIVRTSTSPFTSRNRSTAAPAGITPNRERSTSLEMNEVSDSDRPLLVDAVADGDPGQARHRAGARVGRLHVVGRVGLAEDQVPHAIVAAAVPLGQLRHRHLGPLAEAFGHVDLVAVGDVPRLPLERLHVEPPLLAVERDAVALVRHI